MSKFSAWFVELVISTVECCFPLVPTLSKEELDARDGHGYWQPPEIYYFLDDPSPRWRQRISDILRFDRRGVSFWRKRQQFRKATGWESVTIHQHVS